MADLLLELFSEEIPARMQAAALAHLQDGLRDQLREAGLGIPQMKGYVTPRRLAVWVKDLADAQPDVSTEVKGPKIDAPEAAIQGFLKKNGLTLDALEKRDGVYFATIHKKGRSTAEVLKEIIEKILDEFAWPKSMRWGMGQTPWVRPLHAILCIFGGRVVPIEFAGIKSGNVTYGHRFLSPSPLTIEKAQDYEPTLKRACVIADRNTRKEFIREKAAELAKSLGCTVRDDEGLLEEVTGLVEWPVLLSGRIDDAFMDLPPEVLVSEMRAHQKYFALSDKAGKLAANFIITANMETTDGGKAIITGNERVLRARFADGRFFWDSDRKKKLDDWAKNLESVTYHAKLGTIAQKVDRVAKLAVALAPFVSASLREAQATKQSMDRHAPDSARDDELATKVERAAKLAKADLTTGMVGEFPELQGVMGRYYALAQKEDAAVADAIRDHYKPLGPSDAVPTEPTAMCVALADKLDTLSGMFGIGEKPTGSKDPFALRRAALGVIRIVLENNIRLPLRCVSSCAKAQDPKKVDPAVKPQDDEILQFFTDRLKVQLKDQGVRHDLIAAVSALGEDDLVRLVARVQALQELLSTEDGANLLAAYKRAANILKIEEKKDGRAYDQPVDAQKLQLAEEKALAEMLAKTLPGVKTALDAEDFAAAMKEIARLRTPVDAFFDKVTVNAEDKDLRQNRLCMLSQIRTTLDKIANFALIEG